MTSRLRSCGDRRVSRSTGPIRLRAGWFLVSLLATIGMMVLFAPAGVASAHGEESQQSFERTSTIMFYDVNFSTNELDVNQELTITGNLRVMNAWPDHTISPPNLAYLTINTPGAVFTVEDRELNGVFTPQSVRIQRGATYPFKLVLKARIPGRWHVHPAMAAKGTGTLVGQGQWVTIRNAGGPFTETETLATGKTINLLTYGMSRVVMWQLICLAVALAYVVFWLWRPLLQRAVVLRYGDPSTVLPKRDIKVTAILGVVALAVGMGGYFYAKMHDGPEVPVQVIRVQPPPLEPSALQKGLETSVKSAVFDDKTKTLTLTVTVKNNTKAPTSFDHAQFADYSLYNTDAVANPPEGPYVGRARVTPSGPIQPGETRTLAVTINSKDLSSRNLLPLNEAEVRVTGAMVFRSGGEQAVAEINELSTGILPQYGGE
ncbi:monooxygenase [Mycobacterium sp. SM1]|uniref:methane monooxygenase/ammonia monooxygenase subunit B n=1 Tax=Mycobacterium sp. SM1 TaxID=2816243 RepID=UPI001BCF7BC5|nr:methane monooxygenase/ammonia monooxygenase subunit B [Mycobacterium sp. SM1]MBS4727981.1 monooxygenase [Mycobacterium sp. SM1]